VGGRAPGGCRSAPPHLALVGVARRLVQCIARHPVQDGGGDHALGVEAEEERPQPRSLAADAARGVHRNVVEEQRELLLRGADLDGERDNLEARCVRVDDEEAERGAASGLVEPGAGDDEDLGRLVHPEM